MAELFDLQKFKEKLRRDLDANDGQYDFYIDRAIAKAMFICRNLLPARLGSIQQQIIPIVKGQNWYEVKVRALDSIKKLCFEDKRSDLSLALRPLRISDFLNLPLAIGVPRYYSLLAGRVGIDKVGLDDDCRLVIDYIGLSDQELLNICFDLLDARARYELHREATYDDNAAAKAYQEFKEQLDLQNLLFSRRSSKGQIKATLF